MDRRLFAVVVVFAVLTTGCVSGRSGGESTAPGLTGGEDGGLLTGTAVNRLAGDANSDGDEPDRLAMAGATADAVIVGHANTPSVVAYERPDGRSPMVAELSNPTPTGGPLAFQLVEADVPDGSWVEVLLPVRPNGTTGWVRSAELDLSLNPFRIEVDRADHRISVFRNGRPWLETEVAIGTGATPTPVGRFYIIELLQPPTPDGIYGPFAFGLSGFSETLTSYAGGEGVIGIHGTNEPEAIGTDVSHGCIRVSNDVISRLAGVIPLGTPVLIT